MGTLSGATLMVFARDSRKREAGQFVLTDWVRDLATDMKIADNPSLDQIKEVLTVHMPGKARLVARFLANPDNAQDWLNHVLGFACVVRVGGDRIAWSATTDLAEAEALLSAYCSEPYSLVRKALGIRYHWILLLNQQFLTTPGDIVEAYSDFMDLNTECAIVRC